MDSARRWCQRMLQLWQREEESDCFCFELWIMQSRFKLKSLNHFSGTFRSPVIWNNMDMLQSYCRLKAHSLCPTIKSQHVILWNSRAGWGQGWHVSASDTAFTYTGWILSMPSSSSLSPAVICSTPRPAPQSLCPRSRRRPALTRQTAFPLYTPSAQTPASPWKWDPTSWLGLDKGISQNVASTEEF